MYTVLLVDDNDVIRRCVAKFLEAGGFRTIGTGDGAEALDLAEQSSPDLILLDLSMPGVDGLSVLEEVRERPEWASLPVLMYSAVDDPGVRRRAEKLGAGFLSKGATTGDQIVEEVRGALSTRLAEQAVH